MQKKLNRELKEGLDTKAERFCSIVTKLAKRCGLNVFVITDGHSATDSTNNPIISTISEIAKDVIDNPEYYDVDLMEGVSRKPIHEEGSYDLEAAAAKVATKDKWNLRMDIQGLKKDLVKVQDTASKMDSKFVKELCKMDSYPLSDTIDKDLELNNWCADVDEFLGDQTKPSTDRLHRYELPDLPDFGRL